MKRAISEKQLRRWMRDHGPRLIALSAGICHDRHRAEELVQEAFIKLWQRPPEAGEIAYASWLRRVVTNLSINALQRDRRASTLPEFSTDRALQSCEQPDRSLQSNEELNRVHLALDSLDEHKRAILLLRVFEKLSYDQIADNLGVPVGTVMSRLNRARAALAEAMRLQDGLEGSEEDAPSRGSFPINRYRSA